MICMIWLNLSVTFNVIMYLVALLQQQYVCSKFVSEELKKEILTCSKNITDSRMYDKKSGFLV